MSRPYVCNICRLRYLPETRCRRTVQRRQWSSQFPQESGSHGSIEGVINRSNVYRSGKIRAQSQNDDFPDRERKERRGDGARGRYSGQVLQPEQLLDQLDRSPSHFNNSNQQHPSTPSPRQNPSIRSDNGCGRLPPALWKKCEAFVLASQQPTDDTKMWSILQTIAKEHHDQELKQLRNHRLFRSRCFHWMVRVSRHYADFLTSSVTSDKTTEGLTSPYLGLRILTYLNPDHSELFPNVLWPIASAVSELHGKNRAVLSTFPQFAFESTQELMRIWNLCMRMHLQQETGAEVSLAHALQDSVSTGAIDWSFLPGSAAFEENLQRRVLSGSRRSLPEVLHMLVPSVSGKTFAQNNEGPLVYNYVSSALLTLDLLRNLKSVSGSLKSVDDFEPWVELIEIGYKFAGDIHVPKELSQKQVADNEQVRLHYRGVTERLGLSDRAERKLRVRNLEKDVKSTSLVHGSQDGLLSPLPDPQELHSPEETSSATDRFVITSIKRLSRAMEQDSLKAAERVYEDVQNYLSSYREVQLRLTLYEHLLLTFLSLRKPKVAIAVWNDMIKAGQQPTSKTYTVMMRGCQNMRDISAMESFWNKMRGASIQPDKYAWSTRIFGLLRSNSQVDSGLKALVEMGQEWIAAARTGYTREKSSKSRKNVAPEVQLAELMSHFEDDVDGVPRPDQVILNTAISALATSSDVHIPKALSWGRSFGIEPDLRTYNALINVSMRRGLPGEAMNMIRRMKEQGIEANQTTWTVLLSAMFEGGMLDNMEPREQEARILGFVRSVTGIDEKGYALIIDRLLKNYNNIEAAQAMLAHMSSQGIQPTPHIYTILMASYFQQCPPNFAAAESLWSQIKSSNAGYGAAVDSQFYDRMIESYAAHHSTVGTTPMLKCLSLMEAEGKKPSWRALQSIAQALADAQDWQRLVQLVERVRRRLTEAGVGETRRWGQKEFWRCIISTGVLNHEGVTTPEQIMRMHKQGEE